MKLKALSIQQPWAWAIFNGKTVENRSWKRNHRGFTFIHAGQKYDRQGHVWIEKTFNLVIPKELPTGGIVGMVNIYDCVTICESPWFFGPYGFLMRDGTELPFYRYNGQLGFFDVCYPDALLKAA